MPTDLQEALTASGAAPLIQKQIDPVLLEYQRRYSPFVRALPSQKWGSTVYFFNRRDSLPLGGFVTDGGAVPVSTSVYEQQQFTIRQFQTVGAVTGYAEAVTSDLIGSLRAKEISGAHQGMLWDIETALIWGNQNATSVGPYPQFDGLDVIASTFSGVAQNAIDYSGTNGGAFDLAALDTLIDLVEENVSMPVESSDWMFLAAPAVNSRIAQLLTAQQRFVDQVEVSPGLIVASYRNVPIVKSSFLAPRTTSLGTVTAAASGSGSSLTAQAYYYKVTAVIGRFGETAASAEVTITPTAGQIITLTLPTLPTYENSTPILFKVYRSNATTTETFLGAVDATVAIATDGVTPIKTNVIQDNGTVLTPGYYNGSSTVIPTSTPPAYVPNTGLKPPSAATTSIYLISRDSDNVLRPYVRDMQPVDLYPTTASPDSLPFALVSDCTFAVRAPKYLGRLANATVTLAS